MNWCRLWHDMPNDPKFRTIARLSESRTSDVISVFIHLMVSASSNATERGRTQPNAEDLASALDLTTERVQSILDVMQGRVLDGNRLTGWGKRQPKREDESAERSKNWREMRKLEEFTENTNATERNRTQTTNRRDETRRDETREETEVLSVTEELVNTAVVRTDGQEDSRNSPPPETDSVRPSDATAFPIYSRESQMQAALEGYMRMAGTPFARPFKSPDSRIVKRCLSVVNGTDLGEVFDFLADRFRNCEQSPRHPNGPRKYAWFVTVLSEKFGGHA